MNARELRGRAWTQRVRICGVPHRPGIARCLRSAAALVSGGVALGALAGIAPPSTAATPACGSATTATIAAVDATVVSDIYRNELAGTEVSFDLAQITGAHDLLAAVTTHNQAATLKAVQRIVYHPAWHIVRLRVLDSSGRILADVGGPYVIAPVSGTLRSGGHVVASFVMSVQDDAGVTKLETHFVGDPIGIYAAGKPSVAERDGNLLSRLPGGSQLTLGGASATAWSPRGPPTHFHAGTLDELHPRRPTASRGGNPAVRRGPRRRVRSRRRALREPRAIARAALSGLRRHGQHLHRRPGLRARGGTAAGVQRRLGPGLTADQRHRRVPRQELAGVLVRAGRVDARLSARPARVAAQSVRPAPPDSKLVREWTPQRRIVPTTRPSYSTSSTSTIV